MEKIIVMKMAESKSFTVFLAVSNDKPSTNLIGKYFFILANIPTTLNTINMPPVPARTDVLLCAIDENRTTSVNTHTPNNQ